MSAKEDQDSGMESQNETTKSSPEKPPVDLYADEPDETLSERLWGLTEMFPNRVRNAASSTVDGVKNLYGFSRSSSWFLFRTVIILFGPILLECERVQIEDMQRFQQKQMLLGANPAIAGNMPPVPPLK